MKLNQRVINPLTLWDLNKISQKLNIDTSNDNSGGFYTTKISDSEVTITNNSYIKNIKNKSNENYSDESSDIYDIDNTNITGNLTNKIKKENINYLSSYISKYKAVSLSFLGLNIHLQHNLYINRNTGLEKII